MLNLLLFKHLNPVGNLSEGQSSGEREFYGERRRGDVVQFYGQEPAVAVFFSKSELLLFDKHYYP